MLKVKLGRLQYTTTDGKPGQLQCGGMLFYTLFNPSCPVNTWRMFALEACFSRCS